jgi:Rod binding domain-containing protein
MDSTKCSINGYPILDAPYTSSIVNRAPSIEEQAAKDFESLLLDKLLEAMKSTIEDGSFDTDGASKQVQDIFWLYLSQDIANKGGFGLWKNISEMFEGK